MELLPTTVVDWIVLIIAGVVLWIAFHEVVRGADPTRGNRERLTDRMTGTSVEQIDEAVGAAILSWDEGRAAHVCMVSALSALGDGDLTAVVDGILGVGWLLHSTAMGVRTVGPNMQQIVFVFLRGP